MPALPQTGLEVLPTRTIYTFEGEGVRLTLTFMTAALPDDLMIYSRPVTYVTWRCKRQTERSTRLTVYLDASAEIAVNESTQEVVWSSPAWSATSTVLEVGSRRPADPGEERRRPAD